MEQRKEKLYFLGYFLVFPLIFITSFLLWGFVIQGNGLWTVLTDALSILGIYYILTSIIFGFVMRKEVKFEKE
ncbi:hypothetical protein [Rossellomorea aquimaris]|uniref:Uncharacterized protein n=1 Tax=Rossellomorea aquimaris TaxID=189382 RepID=A0A5D4UNL1_9BACI|nr:hypothetical protein [Rossellomorea aquimaris]TYS81745.1 hypothetical protein FZD05_02730 [Rossellomorea aquimaris]TYS88369.1 hypothetical protein FZC85_02730 [Rossellomorea aquimaris]